LRDSILALLNIEALGFYVESGVCFKENEQIPNQIYRSKNMFSKIFIYK